MSIFDLFRNKPDFKSGALLDDRTAKEKQKDYEHEEVTTAPKVEWKEKPKENWADYPVFDQDGSGSCVAQAITKALGIENIREEDKFVDLSARDIYARRENDGAGMHTPKALKDVAENGATLEQQMPSQGLDEEAMNQDDDRKPSDVLLAQIFKATNYVKVRPDMNAIAEVLEDDHPVIMTVRFKRGEWNRKVPKVGAGSGDWGYHKITAIDYFIHDGERVILIDDSWGPDTGYRGRRLVNADWFRDRIYGCYYFKPMSNIQEDRQRPEYNFQEDLEYHDRSDEVAKLQEALKIEGFFPNNIPCTGYYGGLTRKAVKEFQFHYEVASEEELEEVDGFRVGPKTREKLNELF